MNELFQALLVHLLKSVNYYECIESHIKRKNKIQKSEIDVTFCFFYTMQDRGSFKVHIHSMRTTPNVDDCKNITLTLSTM
jgi:hypothetical protein